MSDLLFWLADQVPLWRPFAIALLSVFVFVVIWYAVAAWESTK